MAWFDRFYRKYRNSKAAVRLWESTFRNEEVEKIVESNDFRKLKTVDAIKLVEEKLRKWRTVQFRVSIYTIAPYLLLYAAINGVDFRINMLGISLSGVESIKEIVFVFGYLIGACSSYLQSGIGILERIQKSLIEKRFGPDKSALQYYLLPEEIPKSSFNVFISSEKYMALWPKIALESSRVLIFLFYGVLAVGVYLFVTISLALNIWESSNLPSPWGRVLVAVLLGVAALETILAILKAVYPFRYIDRDRAAELSLLDPKSGELLPDVKSRIQREVEVRYKVRAIGWLALMIMFWAWFIFFR